jgi:hypothetical protein
MYPGASWGVIGHRQQPEGNNMRNLLLAGIVAVSGFAFAAIPI